MVDRLKFGGREEEVVSEEESKDLLGRYVYCHRCQRMGDHALKQTDELSGSRRRVLMECEHCDREFSFVIRRRRS